MAPQPAPADAPRRLRGHVAKILLGLTGAVCVLVAAALVALHSAPGRRAVLRRVTDLLAAQNIQVQTDGLRYNLFGLSLSLQNLVLRSPDAPDLPPFATIRDLDVKLSLPDLARRKFVIRTGRISDADIKYVIDDRGLDNVPRPPRDPEQADQPLNYLISDLSITRARVEYENRAEGIAATLPLPSVTVTGDRLTDRHRIVAESGGGSVRVKDRTLTFDRLTATVDAGRDDLRVDALRIDAEGSRADLAGTVTNFAAPELALSIQSQVDLARVSRVAQLPDPAAGTANIDVKVTGHARAATPLARRPSPDASRGKPSAIARSTRCSCRPLVRTTLPNARARSSGSTCVRPGVACPAAARLASTPPRRRRCVRPSPASTREP
jgi:uncharacterized protein involved in outer membrane biogenesis